MKKQTMISSYVGTLAFGANVARFDANAPPNWASLPPQSKVYRVNPNGSAGARTTLAVGALHEPNGLAFGSGGKVHVSNYSISASGSQVVRVNY